MNNPVISIIIPVYNAEDSIENLVDILVKNLKDRYTFEIILVNDCSKDKSEDYCIRLFENYPDNIRFFSLAKNVGEHNAVMAGLNQAKGDFSLIMDDDFQNPVSEVIKLIDYAVNKDYDVVYTYYSKKKHNMFRNLGSWFNDKVSNLMLKKPKNLYLSSFKIINSFLVKEIIKYRAPFPYIDGLILRTTSHIGRLKVEHQERRAGRSNYTFKKLISLWLNMFTNFSVIPLRISSITGLILSLFGFILGIITIIEKIINPELPTGYAALLVTVSIFSGIQLMALGMIGEYLGRIFLSQSKKPQYIIRKRYDK